MRTKRGGFAPKSKQGAPRVRLRATVKGGGEASTALTVKTRKHGAHWRELGPGVTIEPLNAGLRRFLKAP